MPPEIALGPHPPLREYLPRHWRMPVLHLALAWVAIAVLFAPVLGDMLRLYWDSSTYNHILFVPAILAWLVWARREELAKLEPGAWWPGLLPLLCALFVWLLGDVSGLALATHLGIVAALQACVLAVLGPRVFAALLFPLTYGFFLVPFGDDLVPALQMVTARLSIVLTVWSGVPATIEGVFIDTPAGLFEVAEACSGVKFLVAMVALGTLAANVCFISWKRRAVFMGAALVLPILANGIRAWGTIRIAQSQGIAFAQGFDHIFYGWVFFALVLGLLLALSWPYFDRPADDRFVRAEDYGRAPLFAALDLFSGRSSAVLAAVMGACLLFFAWAADARDLRAPMPAQIGLPEVANWERVDYRPGVWWEPQADGADHRLLGSYRNAQGSVVDVFFALYSSQQDGKEAGAFGQGALMPDSTWRWYSPGSRFPSGHSDRLRAPGEVRLALTFYRHRDYTGGSVARLKLSNIADRLLFDPHGTSMLILSAREGQDLPAEQVIADFLLSIAPLEEWMDRIAQKP